MLKIPRQQVLERWDVLPDNLKEALLSESNSGIVWQVGALNHLSEEKISIMATIVGDVIFGFLHSDDLTREIQVSLNLNTQIANAISHEINRKVFAPIKSDLEKIYSPISATPETKPEPKIEEIKKAETPPVKPIPAGIKQEIELKPAPLPAAPIIPAIPAAPVAPVAPAPFNSAIPISSDKPFMIHQEAEPRPVVDRSPISSSPTAGWFKKVAPINPFYRNFGEINRQEKIKIPESPTKIRLETFGQKPEEKKESVIAKTEIPKQRIVHYREAEATSPFGKIQNELSSPFSAASGNSEIKSPKEITALNLGTPAPKTKPPELKPPKIETTAEPNIAKLEEPKIVNLSSFKRTNESEIKLEGNIINLKDNKSDL